MKKTAKEPTNPGTAIPAESALEFSDLTGRIIGAAIEVHHELGPGFIESIYANALELMFQLHRIPFEREKQIRIFFRGAVVGSHRPDFIAFGQIVVELKAVKAIHDAHFLVVRSYLRAAGLKHGLVLNFATPMLDIKRVIAP